MPPGGFAGANGNGAGCLGGVSRFPPNPHFICFDPMSDFRPATFVFLRLAATMSSCMYPAGAPRLSSSLNSRSGSTVTRSTSSRLSLVVLVAGLPPAFALKTTNSRSSRRGLVQPLPTRQTDGVDGVCIDSLLDPDEAPARVPVACRLSLDFLRQVLAASSLFASCNPDDAPTVVSSRRPPLASEQN